ncbi:MAG: zinc ribbon domain-containing protein [Nanoarchaeota archaeon]
MSQQKFLFISFVIVLMSIIIMPESLAVGSQCFSDTQCPGSGDWITQSDGITQIKYFCDTDVNQCKVYTGTRTVECSEVKPCTVGDCSSITGKCVNQGSGTLPSDNTQTSNTNNSQNNQGFFNGGLFVLLFILVAVILSKNKKTNEVTTHTGFCSKCGSGLAKNSKFCPKCGKKA